MGLSYIQEAIVNSGVISAVLVLHYGTRANAIFCFGTPIWATFGDFLTKPVTHGGLNLCRLQASAVALALMAVLILLAQARTAWLETKSANLVSLLAWSQLFIRIQNSASSVC